MSLEEQLRNDAQSLREVGWFNRAIMMDAAANEIQKLNERIKLLKSTGDELLEWLKDGTISDSNYRLLANAWQRAKENKP